MNRPSCLSFLVQVRYLDFGSTAMKNFTHYVWQFADTADGTALTYNSLKSLPAEVRADAVLVVPACSSMRCCPGS